MIVCGWCGSRTPDETRCSQCGHARPRQPYDDRGLDVPAVETDAVGRPALDVKDIRRRLKEAAQALGMNPTQQALADALGISVRTLGRWQKLAD